MCDIHSSLEEIVFIAFLGRNGETRLLGLRDPRAPLGRELVLVHLLLAVAVAAVVAPARELLAGLSFVISMQARIAQMTISVRGMACAVGKAAAMCPQESKSACGDKRASNAARCAARRSASFARSASRASSTTPTCSISSSLARSSAVRSACHGGKKERYIVRITTIGVR